MAGAVAIRGLKELQRDMKRLGADLADDLKDELGRAAEPVRQTAEELAVDEISHMGDSRWSQMRIGVTSELVYVAPRSHRRGGSPRPGLAPILMGKAMEPALERHEGELVNRAERMIDRLADLHGF